MSSKDLVAVESAAPVEQPVGLDVQIASELLERVRTEGVSLDLTLCRVGVNDRVSEGSEMRANPCVVGGSGDVEMDIADSRDDVELAAESDDGRAQHVETDRFAVLDLADPSLRQPVRQRGQE